MSNHCLNCYHQWDDPAKGPCSGCINFNRWVSMNFLDKVDDRPIPEPKYNPKDVAFKNKDGGVKYDGGKPQWSLVPFKAMTEVVEVLTYGAKKYSADNWCKVPDAKRRYIDAGFRHFTAYVSGEKVDPETGYSHLAHAICCLLFLLAFEKGEDHEQSNRYS